MRVVVIFLLVLVVGYYLIVYPYRNRGERNWFMVVVTLLLLIPSVGFEMRWQNVEGQASEITKVLSGNEDAHVHCQRLSETWFDATQNLGFVSWDAADTSVLKFNQCQELAGYVSGAWGAPSFEHVQAVHVLTHEAFHVAGVMDEAETECYAVQNDYRTAILLGATEAEAERLASQYWKEMYPFMPDGYKSADCVEDGLYDLSPGDGSFLF